MVHAPRAVGFGRVAGLRVMSSDRSLAGGKLRSRQRRCIQRSMLQDVDAAIVGKDGDLGAAVAVPNEIAEGQALHLEWNAHRLGLRVGSERAVESLLRSSPRLRPRRRRRPGFPMQ